MVSGCAAIQPNRHQNVWCGAPNLARISFDGVSSAHESRNQTKVFCVAESRWQSDHSRATRRDSSQAEGGAIRNTETLMSETSPSPQPAAQQTQPLVVNIQYVKDLSFEVPGAPQIYGQLRGQPQVSINLDVQARRVQEGQSVFEVAIMIRAEAHDTSAQANGQVSTPAPTVFVAELTYAGVFTLNGLPENAVEPVLLVECPRILFPFARNILADVTRDGGFPPVLLQPIDFVALWQSRRNQAGATPAVA
jgi:preprotein translocase subunit SecB